jgi:hypothetical protein
VLLDVSVVLHYSSHGILGKITCIVSRASISHLFASLALFSAYSRAV